MAKDGKKREEKREEKRDEKNEIKLFEGTALHNREAHKEDDRVAVWVKESDLAYEAELKALQIELMKMLQDMQQSKERILAIFEGRDAAGKGGTIQRIISNLNPRNTRVVALSKPNETEQSQWFFQRYLSRLPSAGEFVLFDRSWYNRAMVEPVMGFCTDEQNKRFLKDVPLVEDLLVKDGIKLFKFYFSVSRAVQKERFEGRKTDPLKQYKLSPVDNLAQDYWDQYSVRKFQMLTETNRSVAPWTIVRSDNKKKARINCIKFILSAMSYKDKIAEKHLVPDPEIIVSGIDELRDMEKNLLEPDKLHG